MQAADELYDVRNSLLVGNYHQVIAEGTGARTVKKRPEEVALFNQDRDALVARAQIGLGQYDAVINDLRSSTAPLLIAVRRFAELHKQLAAMTDDATVPTNKLAELAEPVEDPAKALGTGATTTPNTLVDVAVLACAGYVAARDIGTAMTLASKWLHALEGQQYSRQSIELRGILADGYLRLNRPDLAEKEVAQMKAIDDESTLAILLSGMAALRMGAVKPEALNDAVAAFQEVNTRCGQSVAVLNLLALAHLSRGNAKDAERNLLDALGKKSGDPDTVANLAMVAAQLGKPPEVVNKHMNNAKAATPASSWARQLATVEQRFEEAVTMAQ